MTKTRLDNVTAHSSKLVEEPETTPKTETQPEVPSDWEPDEADFEDREEDQPRAAAPSESAMVRNPKVEDALGHWSTLVENFETSALDFYKAVEATLASRRIPKLKMRRINFGEGGVVDAWREYLRIERGDLKVDVCAAPFGTSYFFSWWLSGRQRLGWLAVVLVGAVLLLLTWTSRAFSFGSKVQLSLLLLLVVGVGVPLVQKLLRRVTYYSVDTTLMFKTTVHRVVTETVSGLLSAKGLRALSEDEKKPIMREFLR